MILPFWLIFLGKVLPLETFYFNLTFDGARLFVMAMPSNFENNEKFDRIFRNKDSLQVG